MATPVSLPYPCHYYHYHAHHDAIILVQNTNTSLALKGFKNAFQIVTQCTDITENTKIMISCPSPAQKEQWKNSIVEAISSGGLLY
jgi:hypothetical protein